MDVVKGAENFHKTEALVLTIGSFDGVHLGHQKLIAQTLKRAQEISGSSAVLSFDPHPIRVLFPDKPFFQLFDQDDQVRRLEDLGVDAFIIEKFSKDLAETSAEEFCDQWLFAKLKPKRLVIGYDFRFGANGKGDVELLKEKARSHGAEVEVVEAHKVGEDIVSSSRIRKALLSGDVSEVSLCLGRNYYVKGPVVRGDSRGRKLGFPTANLRVANPLHPKSGVYVTKTLVGGKKFSSISNLGTRPTFHGEQAPVFLETHIFDFSEEIYENEIEVEFCRFLRDEKKFESVEELREQLNKDLMEARAES